MNLLRLRRIAWLLLVCALSLPLISGTALAQEAPVVYQRYDVDIKIQPDGSFLVREIQDVLFNEEFQTAFAEIPTELTESIGSVRVYEILAGAEVEYVDATLIGNDPLLPYTFSTSREGNFVYVDWAYSPTDAGETRTFIVEYVVFGGLWIYPDGDILEWRAVPGDRSGVPIESSTVTVTLPEAVEIDALPVMAYGPDFETRYALSGISNPLTEPTTADQVIFEATNPLPDGQGFQVQVGFPHGIVNAQPSRWQVAEDSANLEVSLPALETTIRIQEDGSLLVEEIHAVAVEAGALYESNRTIATRFLDDIVQVEVYEGDQRFQEARSNCEYCVRITENSRSADWVTYNADYEVVFNDRAAGGVSVAWAYPPLVRGEQAIFVLRYRVLGAIQMLDNNQRLAWTAVYPNRQATVETATLYLYPPPGVRPNQLRVTGGPTEVVDGAVRVIYNGAVEPGQAWEISVEMPTDATTATMPIWQQEIERTVALAAAAEQAQARLQVAFATATGLLLALGIAGLYLAWYTWGRDKPLPEVADYLTEPPSDLAPGLVAYLLDEEPSTKGALAGLFHLASLGFLEIDLEGGMSVRKVATPPNSPETLPDHLRHLLNVLDPVLSTEQDVSYASIEPLFVQALPSTYAKMGESVEIYFDDLPGESRQRWLVWGQWAVILAVILALFLAVGYAARLGWLALGPAFAFIVLGGGLIWLSRHMPRRTDAGVEEAQRWRAFKRYLGNLKQYASVEDAQKILDRYFAYAVAFDQEEIVLESAAEMGTRIPTWSYGPTMRRRWAGRTTAQGPSTSTTPSQPSGAPLSLPPLADRPTLTVPDSQSIGRSLNRASESLGSRLSRSSENLGAVLATAAGTDAATPFGSIQKGTASTFDVLGEILKASSSGGGSSSHRGGRSSSSSSWGSSRSSSRRSSFSSSRSSGSRRSGGGGRRGFR